MILKNTRIYAFFAFRYALVLFLYKLVLINLSLSMFLNVLTEHGKDCASKIPGKPESFKVHQFDLKIINSSNLYNKEYIMCEILL